MNRKELRQFTQWAWDQYESSGELDDLTRVVPDNPELLQPRRASKSLLYWAVSAGDMPAIDLLLELGVRTDSTSGHNSEYVSAAIERRQLELVEKTLPWCRDLNQSNDGFIPLINAIDAGMLEAVGPLLNAGASLTATGINGYTALHRAASVDNADAVVLLTPLYDDIDIPDTYFSGWSRLMVAAYVGSSSAALTLLAHGANPEFRDSDGRTAVDLARANGHETLAAVLLEFRPPA